MLSIACPVVSLLVQCSELRANDPPGSISRWEDTKKKQPKAKESASSANEPTTTVRGGRGRGGFESRGRGRGAERSRAGRGGRAASQTNGTRTADKTTTSASDGWGDTTAPAIEAAAGTSSWENAANGETLTSSDWATDGSKQATTITSAPEPKTDATPASKVTSWNKLFEKPKAPPAPKQALSIPPVPQQQPERTVEETIADERLPPPRTDNRADAIQR